MKIVFIDDSPCIVEKLVQLMSVIPEAIFGGSAADASSAIALIERTSPDAVIIDIHLASGSGLAILRYCTTHSPAILTIVLTADLHPLYRSLCLELGADAFVDKNKEFELLAGKIGVLYRQKHLA